MAPLAGFAAGFRPPGPLGLEALASDARRSFTSPAFVTDTAVRVDFLEVALEGTLVIHSSPGGFRVTALGGPEDSAWSSERAGSSVTSIARI